jgi:hypothetical protein
VVTDRTVLKVHKAASYSPARTLKRPFSRLATSSRLANRIAAPIISALKDKWGHTTMTPKAEKAPQPTVDRVEELAGRILNGDIILPKFQREFVWSKKQVIDLWDSIAQNYPIGSVLLWRSREKLKAERTIADLEIGLTKYDYPVNYLLDGQQRLSSACGALYWKGDDPARLIPLTQVPLDVVSVAGRA